ncbi:hypothetical protein BIW11_02173 [Tropilaelaps mercedesae]|uniref:Uncharacterized protein n=1 Tax=Tropilaelaps mercedesae TaxID=418985 RepID=A0A1V9X2S4_9ACAR|nr:hypothetical protein BIW11_02173 [Tropilaelaps mercedesae]
MFEFAQSITVISILTYLAIVIEVASTQSKPGQKLICFGNDFVTQLVSTLLDRSRENFARNEPNTLGPHKEHIGFLIIYNGRAYNLSKAFVHGQITVDCDSSPTFARLRIPIAIPGFVAVYDYIMPGHIASGKVIASSDYMGMIYTLDTPLQARSTEKTMIAGLDIFRSDNFKLSFTGLGPVTRALSSILYLAYRLVPSVPIGLFKTLTVRTLQTYLNENPIPL